MYLTYSLMLIMNETALPKYLPTDSYDAWIYIYIVQSVNYQNLPNLNHFTEYGPSITSNS